jgi:putative NADPH-quinone reductase
MRVLVILAHPDNKSFNHAIAHAANEELISGGHEIVFHDLYGESFDPVLPAEEIAGDASVPADIEIHCRELVSADGIVVIHPNWWGQPPAILKGWIDRVVRPGVAYEFLEGDQGEGIPNGLLKGKSVVVFNTSNTTEGRERDVFGDPLDLLWKNCIFDLCGASCVTRRMFSVIVVSTAEERKSWLNEVRDIVGRSFPGHLAP